MVGKWKSDVSKTMDGSEYFGFKCKGTIEYLSNGKYNSQQCDWDETGEWKFSENKDLIIHYNINNKYWKKELGTDKLFRSEGPILSVSETELVTVVLDEIEGEIRCYYKRIK